MSRNEHSEPSQAKPQEPGNANPAQLSDDQLDKIVGGETSLGATMAGAAAGGVGGAAVGGAGGPSVRGSGLIKSIKDTISSVITGR
jgi:hypothetical protein